MLLAYLDASTVHGLRYVAKTRALVRAAWVACVTVSFCAAACIIYLNVEGWRNSPAVVTSVEPAVDVSKVKVDKKFTIQILRMPFCYAEGACVNVTE